MSVQVKNNLRYIHTLHPDATDAALRRSGEFIKELGSQLAPVSEEDREHLKDSGKVEQKERGLVEVSFGNDLPDGRAIHVEFGTSVSPAQPYLGPAMNAIDVTLEIAKELKRKLQTLQVR